MHSIERQIINIIRLVIDKHNIVLNIARRPRSAILFEIIIVQSNLRGARPGVRAGGGMETGSNAAKEKEDRALGERDSCGAVKSEGRRRRAAAETVASARREYDEETGAGRGAGSGERMTNDE